MMKFIVAALALLCLVSVSSAMSLEKVHMEKLTQHAMQQVTLLSKDQNAMEVFRQLEKEVLAKKKAGVTGLSCTKKLTWAGAVKFFSKKLNKGQGVSKFEEWTPTKTSSVSILLEANAAAAAGVGISVGLGIGFEFNVKWKGSDPDFEDSGIALCANTDINIGVQFGANAGGTVYLIFGKLEKAGDSNCGVGADVYAAIGGGIQVMLKCPSGFKDVKAAYDKFKAGIKGVKDKLKLSDKLKEIVKGAVKLASATVIGVAFSAGVGVGGTPVSATYSIEDLVKKAIPTAWKDWASNTAKEVKGKWNDFVASAKAKVSGKGKKGKKL